MTDSTEIGTITQAADRYGTDAAGIWAWICSKRPRTLTDGRTVRLEARRSHKLGGRWLVTEHPETTRGDRA